MKRNTVPASLVHFFWGDDIRTIDTQKHKKYILTSLLEYGDRQAVAWCLKTYGRETIKKMLPLLRLSDKSSAFWQSYL